MPTPIHILILEDSPADVGLLLHELRRAEFEPRWQQVATKSDFLAGLTPPPDIILADYTLPQFDALRALRCVQERAPDVPLIVVTGALSDEAAVACLKQGAADYLLKDRLGRLGEAVRQALAARDLRVRHRQAHDALRASEERFRALSEHANDLVGILDADGTYRYASPSHRRILGYAPAEVQGRNVFELMHPDDVPHTHAAFAALMQSPGAMEAAAFRMRHADGSWRTLEGIGTNRLHDPAVRGIIANARDITERKRAEEERIILLAREQTARQVAEARAQLAAIVNASEDAIIGKTLDGTITSWNPAAARLYGYSAEEAIGQSIALLFPPEHRDELPELLGRVAWGESIAQFETERRRKDSTRVAVSLSIAPVRSTSGTVVGAAVVARDITERKRAEEALRASEARLRTVIGNAPLLLYVVDQDGTYLFCDGQGLRGMGVESQQVLGHCIFDQEQERPYVTEAVRRALAGENASFIGHWDTITFENRVVPLRDAAGRVMGALGVALDVTERVRAEEELRASEERFRCVTESAHDAIIGADSQGTIVSWNAGAGTMFGYRADEVLGQPLTVLMSERYHAAHRHGLERLTATGTSRLLGQVVELQGQRKDGSEFPLELSLSTWDTAQGRFYSGIIRDITERKRAEAALEESNRALERANRVKSDFLAMMSHEIRTPMNGVIGMTGLLLDTDLSAEQREYAETVRTSGEALLTIINDILDFSKIEAGRLELEVGDVDVQRTVEDVLDLLAPQAHAKGLELAALVTEDVPPVLRGDPGRLRQILLNLVGNAVKFTPAGEVVVRASVDDATDEAVVVRVTVADTGVGIAPDARAQLFEPFTQANGSAARRYGGTGLGLAICKRLVELMGGEIGVESVLGQGSTFWFTVRLRTSPRTSDAAPLREVALEGRRVLVVDDNATTRSILQHHLTRGGTRTDAAADGPSALGLLRQAHQQGAAYDLVVLDLHLPGMDGLELAQAIRADPALASTRLVLLAGATPGERGTLARQGAIDASLTKPVRPAQLYACLAAVLAGLGEGAAAAAHPSASPADPAPMRPSQGRVLVVEDNAVNQRVAVRMLEKRGYRADAVANGREAVAVLAQRPYDLVLMDCQMPEMDGYAATAEVRRREQARGTPHTPIIAMTANAMAGDDQACLAAGMDAYIPKPVTRAHLDAVLAQWHKAATPAAPGVTLVAAPGDDILDSSALTALRDLQGEGEPDVLAAVIADYLRDTPPRLAALDEAVARTDAEALRRAAHSLKGSSSQIGALHVARLCADLEEQASTTDLRGVTATLRRLDDALDRVRAHLLTRAGGGAES
jgi:PAS domain S-box-containing protein